MANSAFITGAEEGQKGTLEGQKGTLQIAVADWEYWVNKKPVSSWFIYSTEPICNVPWLVGKAGTAGLPTAADGDGSGGSGLRPRMLNLHNRNLVVRDGRVG
jgi:hypothetical protein